MYINQTKLMGYLGANPEVRQTKSGKDVANFSIGINKRKKDPKTGEAKDVASWFKVSVLNPSLVTITKDYLKKGTRVLVNGELKNSKWSDKDGKDHLVTEVVIGNGGSIQFENSKESKPA